MRRVMREAGAEGLRVRYASGHTRRLDSAARMNLLDGIRKLNQSCMMQVGEAFGADGIEIDAHMLCAEDHLPYQGGQYSNAEFGEIQDSLDRPFGEWNCRHTWHPILMGISPKTYTDEQLGKMRRYSTEEVTIDGRTKTRYAWSQEMRRIETEVRKQKDTANLARESGDDKLRRECQGKILALNERYRDVARASGLKTEFERTYVGGFRDVGLTGGASSYERMSKAGEDRIIAAPIHHTTEELDKLARYAEDHGIRVYQIETFDGDVEMFKEQVDAIAEIREEYGLKGKLAIKFGNMESAGDLAVTNKEGDLITFSAVAMRDKEATNRYLNSDNYLAATDSKGIAYHEMGHVISKLLCGRGIDIATEAYYNINGKSTSYPELFDYLEANVSEYTTFKQLYWAEKPFKKRYYKEIIPEVLSKDKTNPTDFTREFIRLLKLRCGV